MQPLGDWYLVANRNDLAIKILRPITVGETADGELVIDARSPAERWLTLTVESDGQLLVTHQAETCSLECPGKWVSHAAGVAVPKGAVLDLPNNQIYVSGDLQRGMAEQRIIVSRADEATQADDATRAGAAAAAADPAPAEPVKPALQAAEPPPLTVETGIDASVERGGPSPSAESVSTATSTKSLVIWAAVLLLPVAGLLVWSSLERSPARQPDTAQAPARVTAQIEPRDPEPVPVLPEPEAEPVPTQSASPAPDQPAESFDSTAADPLPGLEPDAVAMSEPAEASAPQGIPESEQTPDQVSEPALLADAVLLPEPLPQPRDVAEELRFARDLLAEGFVTWPLQDNAVVRLERALTLDPGNVEARRLLDEAAEYLLDEARQAHADGFSEGAIKVVDEVLRFRPRLQSGLDLRAEIVDA